MDGSKVTGERSFWLHKGAEVEAARKFFIWALKKEYIFISYAMEAEARSLLTLLRGQDLSGFKSIDLYLEYRCLLNHNERLAYGEQYVEGRVLVTKPPKNKWVVSAVGEEDDDHRKPSYSLAAACFKLLGIKIDSEEKTRMRDLIIRADPEEIEAHRGDILKYNGSDIRHLYSLFLNMAGRYPPKNISIEEWKKSALLRGDYAVRTARMVELGYPINMKKVSRFMANTNKILKHAAEECLTSEPGLKSFRYVEKVDRYVLNTKTVMAWVEKQNKPYWRKTDGGKLGKPQLSISKDAFRDWYDSDSPGFAGAFCRYLKTKQSLNGFLPGKSKKGKFTDFVGSDNRVRPYFGIYGSQSSRSQPAATGFIPLKAHWMRNFIEAPKGKALAGIDYASQEFLIAAIISQDKRMIEAYRSGDVYLAFAKDAGLVPLDATKKSHFRMREGCKALVLGISYDMSPKGLAPRLTQAMGEEVSEDRASGLIDIFFETYSDYKEWKKTTLEDYEFDGRLALPDGWVMWGDNPNFRSVGNFPIQGHGAVIMREAVRRSQDLGLNVVFTLHDALYIEYDSFKVEAIEVLMTCMQEAFQAVMSPYGETIPIRLEGESWSVDYGESLPRGIDKVEYLKEYVDEKGRKDLDRYRNFFDSTELGTTKL